MSSQQKKDLCLFLCLFVIIRCAFIGFRYYFCSMTGQPFNEWFLFMDGTWYYDIAKNGYQDFTTAFFPLSPMIIRYGGPFFAIVINNLLMLGSTYLLYKNFSKEVAIFFLLSPIQVYSLSFYTESLFLFFTIAAYCSYKQHKPYLTGILLGLGVCSRSFGSLLFFAIFIDMCVLWWNDRKNQNTKQHLITILKTYVPATIISCIYPFYLYKTF